LVKKRGGRSKPPRNTVDLEVEPETVQAPIPAPTLQAVPQAPAPPPKPAPTPAPAPATVPAIPVEEKPQPKPGMPTLEEITAYRKKMSFYTEQLTPSVGVGKTQKMRAFITRMSGVAPLEMTSAQWVETLSWFEKQTAEKGLAVLLAHIEATVGA
jgi:hypothetical protein